MLTNQFVDALSSKRKGARLRALKKLAKIRGEKEYCDDTLLSIHTDYSFSPYSPSLACFMADKFGLRLAGIMDNYTLSGADEFIKASKILGVTYSTGVQIRAKFDFLGGAFYNVSVMGIASRFFKDVEKRLSIFQQNQYSNVLKTTEEINARFEKYGVKIDFKKDVLSQVKKSKSKVYLSKYAYFSLSKNLKEKFSKEKVVEILKELGLNLTNEEIKLLTVENNVYYEYDLASILFLQKSKFSAKKNYENAASAVALSKDVGAICSFEYEILEKLEDNDENKKELSSLIENLKKLGFDGFSFDPSKMDEGLRNAVFDKLNELEMLPFLLSSIEFPRQDFKFRFPDERSENLMKQSSYVVVGSEMSQNQTAEGYVLSSLNVNFEDKVRLFAKIGRGE